MFHLFFGFLYFLPTIVAVHRGHHVVPILLMNIFFGWTGIGWIAMLIWALCSYPYSPRYYYAAPPPPGAYDPNHPYWRRY